ncbi:hypothetical protein DUI87_23212 [Hirundo rustica rustica]|uniref:Uncharacterized protein n=1 Tax=Hirundo rustica rustica TaxID=333673 RepID=A0A3M0JIR5_HIRRU|nr:hypothetical protein DUI87_23212 [Hirundo rustica rustica]
MAIWSILQSAMSELVKALKCIMISNLPESSSLFSRRGEEEERRGEERRGEERRGEERRGEERRGEERRGEERRGERRGEERRGEERRGEERRDQHCGLWPRSKEQSQPKRLQTRSISSSESYSSLLVIPKGKKTAVFKPLEAMY